MSVTCDFLSPKISRNEWKEQSSLLLDMHAASKSAPVRQKAHEPTADRIWAKRRFNLTELASTAAPPLVMAEWFSWTLHYWFWLKCLHSNWMDSNVNLYIFFFWWIHGPLGLPTPWNGNEGQGVQRYAHRTHMPHTYMTALLLLHLLHLNIHT